MANKIFRVVVTLTDFEQETADTSFMVSIDTDTGGDGGGPMTWTEIELEVAGYVNAIVGLSNANRANTSIIHQTAGSRAAFTKPTAAYPSVEDKAFLTLQAVDGSTMQLSVPAPKDSIFLSDQETVGPNTGIDGPPPTLMKLFRQTWDQGPNAGLSSAVSTTGSDYEAYLYGYRTRRHSKSEKPGRAPAIG